RREVPPAIGGERSSGSLPGTGGPAEKAGIRLGDRIVAFNGQPVGGIDALQLLLTEQQVGVPSKITVLRLTEKLDFEVTPVLSPSGTRGTRPPAFALAGDPSPRGLPDQ